MRTSRASIAIVAAVLAALPAAAALGGPPAPTAKPAAASSGSPKVAPAPPGSGTASTTSKTPPAPGTTASPTAAAPPPLEELFKAFRTAAQGRDWPKAYELMQKAYAQRQSYDVLGNLGTAELELGKYRDAAEHLARSLADMPVTAKPEVKKVTEDNFTRALGEVGTVILKVSPPQARVVVGDRTYDPGDYRDKIFVEPGAVTVSAGDAVGYAPDKKQVTLARGHSAVVELYLKAEAGPGPSVTATASAVPTAVPGGNPVVLWGGVGLAVVGIGVGAGLLGAGLGKKGEADSLRNMLLAQGKNVCAPGSAAAADCKKYVDAGTTGATLGNAGAGMLIGAGAVAVGTLIYFLVTRSKEAPPVKAGVALGPFGGAFSVQGSF